MAESQRKKKIMTNAYKIRALWHWGIDEGALLGRMLSGPQRLAESPHKINPSPVCMCVQRNVYSSECLKILFIASVFLGAKMEKHPKCPSTEDWIHKCDVAVCVYV